MVTRDEQLNQVGQEEANAVFCTAGKEPLGGGGRVLGAHIVIGSFPSSSGWTIVTSPIGSSSSVATLRLYVVCAEVAP